MTAELFGCPMCGHRFDPAEHAACIACPLHKGCSLLCCPACGHTTIDPQRSRLARWLTARLPKPGRRAATPWAAAGHTLAHVPPGGRARIVELGKMPAVQRERLQAYGLAPGRWVGVLQHSPVTVVQIDQTELAFEADLAAQVFVEL
jgi:Fe2+ transport system protein FeoA